MKNLILNETPKRTSKSFGINNIQTDIDIPNLIEFNNIKIDSEIEVLNKKVSFNLKYDINSELTTQLKNANKNIYINIEKKLEKPINIEFELDNTNNILVDNISINAKKNSKATVIIKYKSLVEQNGYHNGVCNVYAEEGADIQIVVINLLNEKTQNYFIMNNVIEKNANVQYIISEFGGEKSITNYYSNLAGESSKNTIKTMYIGKNEQLLDINYISEVYGENANIDIEVYGALSDKSKKNFKGTIDFKKGCKKSIGNENEYCMLLSKMAQAKSLPMLLCSEEDIQGTHSNSAGKIDEDKLYYIMSRGFTLEQAKKLMVKAQFSSIINEIGDEKLIEEINTEIDKRI